MVLKGVLSTPFGQDHYSHLCVCHICSRATILGLHHFFRRARFCCLDPSFHFVSPRTVEKNLVVTIGEEEDSSYPIEEVSAPVLWNVSHEEAIAFLCNLGSSLYNYNGSKTTLPFWNYVYWFVKIDTIFGWTLEGSSSVVHDLYFAPGKRINCSIVRVWHIRIHNWIAILSSCVVYSSVPLCFLFSLHVCSCTLIAQDQDPTRPVHFCHCPFSILH